MSPELKRLLNTLNEVHGQVQLSRVHRTEYVAIHKTKRKDAIWCLIKTLEKRGKDQSYFESASFQDDLAEFFLPDTAGEGQPKKSIKGGRIVIKKEIDRVIAKIWPDPDLHSELPPEIAVQEPVITPPAQERIIREDVVEAPYDADDQTALDEDFLNQLKEIADE